MVFKDEVIKELLGESLDMFGELCTYGDNVKRITMRENDPEHFEKLLKKADTSRRKVSNYRSKLKSDCDAVFGAALKTVRNQRVLKNLTDSHNRIEAKLREIADVISTTDNMFSLLTTEEKAAFKADEFNDLIWEEKVMVGNIRRELNVVRGSYTYK